MKIRHDLPGHISILDSQGNLLLRWISANRCAPGNFAAPHAICVDSNDSIYVGEVTYTFGVSKGLVLPDCHISIRYIPKKTVDARSLVCYFANRGLEMTTIDISRRLTQKWCCTLAAGKRSDWKNYSPSVT